MSGNRYQDDLTGRRYLVTGAAGGIGSEVVHLLAACGADVLALDISERRLAACAQQWEARPGSVVTARVDVGDEAEVQNAVDAGIELLGGLEGIANIAGGMPKITSEIFDLDLRSFSLADWQAMFRLNVESTFLVTRAVLPAFESTGYGKVVNVASLAAFGRHPRMGNVGYDAAKAAVIGMTQSLSRTLGPHGVRVNAVAPGSTLSASVREKLDPEQLEFHESQTPLGRTGEPVDVANAIGFLMGPASDHISGETIRVAGGLR